jgi:hypothetical protein
MNHRFQLTFQGEEMRQNRLLCFQRSSLWVPVRRRLVPARQSFRRLLTWARQPLRGSVRWNIRQQSRGRQGKQCFHTSLLGNIHQSHAIGYVTRLILAKTIPLCVDARRGRTRHVQFVRNQNAFNHSIQLF